MSGCRRPRVQPRSPADQHALKTGDLVEHFFRLEYARLVAVLTRRAGSRHLGAIEDAVQAALLKALETWTTGGVPDNPSGWLYIVARNGLLSQLRLQRDRQTLLDKNAADPTDALEPVEQPGDADRDLLHMLFVCCAESLPLESQLVLALKTLCGFSVPEIAARLLISEANVYKRLTRARTALKTQERFTPGDDDAPPPARLSSVNRVIYVLFAEGYLSARSEAAIRQELCDEAIRLAELLAAHPNGPTPETCALLALMHMHTARLGARRSAAGGLLLLEEQDRSLWDRAAIGTGLAWLARSAAGSQFSRFHAEAAIAAEHCLAPTFARWDKVAELYGLLQRAAPSPVHQLNAAIAVAEWLGPEAGLAHLDGLDVSGTHGLAYMHAAVLSDLNRRSGHSDRASRLAAEALAHAPTPAVRELLARRLTSAA